MATTTRQHSDSSGDLHGTCHASLFVSIGQNVAGAAEDVASPSQVSAYLVEGMPDARVMVLKDQIETWPLVKEVEYISPQQGLADLSQYAVLTKH